jgi:hypothetical protein
MKEAALISDNSCKELDPPFSLAIRRRREIEKYNAEYFDIHYWREDRGTSNRAPAGTCQAA